MRVIEDAANVAGYIISTIFQIQPSDWASIILLFVSFIFLYLQWKKLYIRSIYFRFEDYNKLSFFSMAVSHLCAALASNIKAAIFLSASISIFLHGRESYDHSIINSVGFVISFLIVSASATLAAALAIFGRMENDTIALYNRLIDLNMKFFQEISKENSIADKDDREALVLSLSEIDRYSLGYGREKRDRLYELVSRISNNAAAKNISDHGNCLILAGEIEKTLNYATHQEFRYILFPRLYIKIPYYIILLLITNLTFLFIHIIFNNLITSLVLEGSIFLSFIGAASYILSFISNLRQETNELFQIDGHEEAVDDLFENDQ